MEAFFHKIFTFVGIVLAAIGLNFTSVPKASTQIVQKVIQAQTATSAAQPDNNPKNGWCEVKGNMFKSSENYCNNIRGTWKVESQSDAGSIPSQPINFQNYGWYMHNGQSMQYVNGQWYPMPQQNIQQPTSPNSQPVPAPQEAKSMEERLAPQIISVSDNMGNNFSMNCTWYLTHYECYPMGNPEPTISIQKNPQLTLTVRAQDPNNRHISYRFSYSGGCGWIDSNTCTSALDPKALGYQTFVIDIKNDDNYQSVGLDADTAIHYHVTD